MILVPFILGIVYLIVHSPSRSCKVELRENLAVSPNCPNETRQVTSFGEIRIISPVQRQDCDQKSAQGWKNRSYRSRIQGCKSASQRPL